MLNAQQDFLMFLINRYAKSSMRGSDLAIWGNVSPSFGGKDSEVIFCIIVNRIDVAVFRIDIKATLKLDVCFQTSHFPYRFRNIVWPTVVCSVVHKKVKEILIRKDHFI